MSLKIKSIQSSALQQSSQQPSNYLNLPVKSRSKIAKPDADQPAENLIEGNKPLMVIYSHPKSDQAKARPFQKKKKQ